MKFLILLNLIGSSLFIIAGLQEPYLFILGGIYIGLLVLLLVLNKMGERYE